jgi:hypothetical protein
LWGLAISAFAPNQNMALLLIIVVLVPQFLFAGGLLPLDLIPGGEIISYVVSTRWAFEAAVNITEFGEPLVDDPCWDNLDKHGEGGELGWNDYLNLNDEEKVEKCTCMGSNIFTGPCRDFPGIMNDDYYTDDARTTLAQPDPTQPEQPTPWPTFTPIPTLTPYPTMTPLPTPSKYQDVREEQGDKYEAAMEEYADDRAEWQRNREQAIGGAEGMLKSIFEGYGHAFRGGCSERWSIMGLIMVGLLILIVVFQKRKDTV